MTVEYVRYTIPTEQADDFAAAYRRAADSLRASIYCRSVDLARCDEDPTSWILRIHWSSSEDHLQRFRTSDQFRTFFAEIRPYVDAITEMRHYTPVPVMPSLYEWAGGVDALERLLVHFYDRVALDDVLGPVFAEMSADHPRHVAAWLGEVLGGPATYSAATGA